LDKEADMASGLLKAMFVKTGTSEGHLGAGDGPSLSQSTPEDGTTLALSRHQVEILRKCQQNKALLDLIAITGRSDRTKFRHQVLNPLIDMGLVEMTIPDKPRSSKQKYRLTTKGRQILKRPRGHE
jgi:ATP-dependent DNA helicase RecG